jgi:hypothetical protein
MKKFFILFALILGGAFVWLQSCQNPGEEKADYVAEIQFKADNLSNISMGKKGIINEIPACKDLEADYIKILINGEWYNLALVDVGNGTETEVLKLPEGTYSIQEFLVYSEDGELLQASPHEGSYYDNLFNFEDNVVVKFESKAFHKYKIDIDVLCFNEPDYDKFNFEWFDYNVSEVNSLCFFGDVCTKLWEDWGVFGNSDTNPYFDWVYGYDMYAVFQVDITNPNGSVTTNTNNPFNVKNPDVVCVEYVDNLEVDDEQYTVDLYLYTPDGDKHLVYTDTLNEAGMSALAGEDGIFTFAVGSCNYPGNEIEAVLPLEWVALPDQITFKLFNNGNDSYFGLDVESLVGYSTGQMQAPSIINAYCGNKNAIIHYGHEYKANVYAWYEASAIPNYNFTNEQVEELNWIVNNLQDLKSTYGMMEVQKLIWDILEYTSGTSAINMPNVSGYIPPLGGWVVVFIDPIEDLTTQSTPDQGIQMAIFRLDP